MQVLYTLAVFHIRLPARYVLDVMCIDQAHLDISLFEYLEQRNPIHSSGFHGYGLDLALLKPVCESFQFDSEGFKTSNRLGIAIGGDRNKHLCRSNVDSSGVGLDHG